MLLPLAEIEVAAAIEANITIDADHSSLAGFLASTGRSINPVRTEANKQAKRRQGGEDALRVTKIVLTEVKK